MNSAELISEPSRGVCFKQSMFPGLRFLVKTHGRNHFSKPEMSWRLWREKCKYVLSTGAYVAWLKNPASYVLS